MSLQRNVYKTPIGKPGEGDSGPQDAALSLGTSRPFATRRVAEGLFVSARQAPRQGDESGSVPSLPLFTDGIEKILAHLALSPASAHGPPAQSAPVLHSFPLTAVAEGPDTLARPGGAA